MMELDAIAPNYRRCKERWPDAPILSAHYDAMISCYRCNGHGLVEYVKAFIECVCVTILTEFAKPMPVGTRGDPTTTQYLVVALECVGLQNSRDASGISQVLTGLNGFADALSTMRNQNGPVAHGKDAFMDALTSEHVRTFLHVADAILGVLLNALEGKEPDLLATREPYSRFKHLGERIDKAVRLKAEVDDEEASVLLLSIGDDRTPIRIPLSEFLYAWDRSMFIDLWKSLGERQEGESLEEPEPTVSSPLGQGKAASFEAAKVLAYTVQYNGRLSRLCNGLQNFLQAENIVPNKENMNGAVLLDSLLTTADSAMGTDWKQREQLQARLRTASRRIFIEFGYADKAGDVAEKFVRWLKNQAPE